MFGDAAAAYFDVVNCCDDSTMPGTNQNAIGHTAVEWRVVINPLT